MILERVIKYYGNIGPEEQSFIQSNINRLTEEQQNAFTKKLFTAYPQGRTIPDVEVLTRIYNEVSGKSPRKVFWSVCMTCKAEYDYDLPYCPVCYSKGVLSRQYAVRSCIGQFPAKVIRYNKGYIGDGTEPVCYTCDDKDMSFCSHFGKEDWECRDYRNCKCVSCCIQNKRKNAELKKKEVGK